MHLFFDVETTGLPLNWKAPVTDVDNWPRMIQLAFMVYVPEGDGLVASHERNYIIKPNGFTIPEEVAKIHGITNERAMDEGVDLQVVLDEFHSLVTESRIMVAHNISFDRKIVGAEFIRAGMEDALHEKERICTMLGSAKYCALPKMKWPKLTELHEKLFGVGFENAHDALADIRATASCFFELRKRGVI